MLSTLKLAPLGANPFPYEVTPLKKGEGTGMKRTMLDFLPLEVFLFILRVSKCYLHFSSYFCVQREVSIFHFNYKDVNVGRVSLFISALQR